MLLTPTPDLVCFTPMSELVKPLERNWCLRVLKNDLPGEVIPLSTGENSIGRDESNQIALPHESVSRKHATISCAAHGVVIRDLESRNGVLVNGAPRRQARLQDGDRLQIGDFSFMLSALEQEAATRVSLRKSAQATAALQQTAKAKILLPESNYERKLSTLYHICFWVAEGVQDDALLGKTLCLLQESFRAAEAHYYDADGNLLKTHCESERKTAIKLASFMSERFQTAPEAMRVGSTEIAMHQRRLGNFNYLVGPLRISPNVKERCAFVLLVRPVEWEDFTPDDRVLLQAVCQLWSRGQNRARQMAEIKQENVRLKAQSSAAVMLGTGPSMEKLREQAKKAASTKITVLLQGETGSGKEVVAQFIHDNSPRNSGPFVKVNCAAIPVGLIESELFGHLKGAFTDAHAARRGKFSQADGGTLLLDEIGEMPLQVQSKVLRVIETGEVEPLGSEAAIKIDVRFIAASHRNLMEMVRLGQFREDLYYRLNVVRIHVPPLRDHLEDMEALAEHFLHKFVTENGLAEITLSQAAVKRLKQHAWPGNVRELRNVVQACAVASETNEIASESISKKICERGD
jgi:MoxR-like ATPase